MTKKLLNSMRVLLVAAGLCVGGNAWADTTTVGAADNSAAWFTAFSDYYTLGANQTLTLNFKNYSSKEQNWHNWVAYVVSDADRGASGYQEYIALRADNAGWGNRWEPSNLTSNYNWTTFKNDMHGSDVELTVTRNGALVTIHADITTASSTKYYENYYSVCGAGTQNIRVFLTVEKAHLTDITSNIADNGNTSESTGYGKELAHIDFSNAISASTVTGQTNSMTLSGNFELGYTSGDPATTTLGDVLRVGNGTGTVTIPDLDLNGTRDEVIISFDMWFGYLGGKDAGFYLYDNAGTPVAIGNLYKRQNGTTSDANNMFGLDVSKITSVGSQTEANQNAGICRNDNKTTFNIHLDYGTNTMYVVQYTNGTLKQTTTPVSLGSSNPLKKFEVKSNYNTDARRCWFDNLHIYTIRGDYSVVPVGYTVKFQDTEGNTIKADDTSRSALAGTEISTLATTADKTTFYNDGDIANNNTVEFAEAINKYVFKSVSAVTSSSDDTSVDEVAAAGHVVTIVYDKYIKYDYTIKRKLGTADATSLQSNSLWQDQTLTYYYPVCVKDGDDYYITEKKNTTPYFGVVVTKDNANPVINYTQDNRIVYYVESDDMAGSRYNYSQAASYSSDGKSWCSGASDNSYLATNWTLGAGSYDIEVGMANRNYAVSPAPQLKSSTDDETPVNLTAISLASSSYTVKNYTSQAIAADEQLYFYNDNESNASKWALDYVIVRSLPASQSIEVTSAGFATYVNSDYDLNFSSTDIEAYKVKVSTKGVAKLTKVNNVPAGTPVLLYKDGGATEDIPVMTGAAAVSDNDLVAGTGAKVATTDGDYTNMILNNVNDQIGFYFANGQTVATNRAYLHIATSLAPNAANARMSLVFADDETNGINNVESKKSENGAYYNLSGQRVSKPAKGLFIQNGKKVIVK